LEITLNLKPPLPPQKKRVLDFSLSCWRKEEVGEKWWGEREGVEKDKAY